MFLCHLIHRACPTTQLQAGELWGHWNSAVSGRRKMLPARPSGLFHRGTLQGETAGASGNRQVSPQPPIRTDKQLHMYHCSLFCSSLKLLQDQNAERRLSVKCQTAAALCRGWVGGSLNLSPSLTHISLVRLNQQDNIS